MEITDFFDALPNEVFQLIFAAVADCKSLVRCMVVSKVFKEQSSRVTSLAITCPGQFSSYDQKLKGIYAMVKEFQLLESLIVRIGHPKDEPPSWARCMRYAEIGASVEKFIFMAAKSGDFSEFDYAIGCGQEFHENGLELKTRNLYSHSTFQNNNNRIDINPPRYEQEIVPNIQAPIRIEENSTIIQNAILSNIGIESNIINILGQEPTFVSSNFQDQTHLLLEHYDRNLNQENYTLQDFNLREVIAPNNDVLKKMVPVIVFAIVQGLDEFRDCVPKFIAYFTKLKQFLLVDMVESVTIHMRDSHIEEIRLQHIQDKKGESVKRTCEEKIISSKPSPNHVKSNFIKKGENIKNNNNVCNIQPKTIQNTMCLQKSKARNELDNNIDGNFGMSSNTLNNMPSTKNFEIVEMKVGVDDLNDTNNEKSKLKCKRCKNLDAVGINGSCWTCVNKGTTAKSFEKIRNSNCFETMASREMFDKKPCSIDNKALHLRNGINDKQQSVQHLGSASLRMKTFRSLFGVPEGVIHLNPSNSALLSNHAMNTNSFAKGLPNTITLQDVPLLDIPSTSSNVRTPNQQKPKEIIHTNLCGFGGSQSFDSIEILKDYEECEEIKSMEGKVLQTQNMQKTGLQLYPQHMLRRFSESSVGKKKKLKEKTNNCGASNVFYHETEDPSKKITPTHQYLSARNSYCNAMKHKEIEQVPQTERFWSFNESQSDLRKNCAQDDPSTSNINISKIEKILQVETSLHAHTSNVLSNLKSLKTQGTNLSMSGSSLRIESNNTNDSKPSTKIPNQSEFSKKSKNKEVVDESSKCATVEESNTVLDSHMDATMNIVQSSNGSCENNSSRSLIDVKESNSSTLGTSETTKCETNLSQHLLLSSNRNTETSNSCSQGSLNPLQGRGIERQRNKTIDNDAISWPTRREGCSSERLQSATDMQTQREHQVLDKAIQLGVHGLQEQTVPRETWRERVGPAERGMQYEDRHESGREREVCREPLQEGVRKQRELAREALFFDISFWRTEQIIASKYCLSDVSMCIATHEAKPLTPLELDVLSRAALAGPLLAATIAHVNKHGNKHKL